MIVVIKHRGLGRGGELIELTMIICLYLFKGDHSLVQKTVLLRKSKVRLSWMVEELIDLGSVKQKMYEDFRSLVEELKQEIDLNIAKYRIVLTSERLYTLKEIVEGVRKLVKAYSVQHNLDVKDFINNYMMLLNNILEDLWQAIEWKKKGERLIPSIRRDRIFRKKLRDTYIRGRIYSKHYVDSAIKQAYSILNSWRKRYLKGKACREKPTLRRRFVRVKETLYSCKGGIIRISIKPFQESIYIDLKKAWFWGRIAGLDLGELILKEDMLIVTVRRRVKLKVENPIAWDVNLLTIDGYDGGRDYTVDLRSIYTIHRVYELKRGRIQQLPEKTRGKLLQKYSLRERSRVDDLLHKAAKQLANRTNIFEDLRGFKENVAGTKSRSMNRQNSKHNYIKLQRYVEYKSAWNGYFTVYVKPKLTSKTCSGCGYVNRDLKGEGMFECPSCGLKMGRQKNASRNIWKRFLKMWGEGFTPKGAKPNEMPPMNPEGDEGGEAQELSKGSIRIYT